MKSSKLHLKYMLRGPTAALHLPPPVKEGTWTEDLWKTTCFEAFYKLEKQNAYSEWNFSPSGNYWSMDFSEPRKRVSPFHARAPQKSLHVEISNSELRVEAIIEIKRLPIELGICAIIDFINGERSHWAIKHPGAKPDFHDSRSFVHFLESPDI